MYGKIFDSMYEGTLYGHWEAIVTLQQMLVLCDSEGTIDMTPQAMSARTSIPLDIVTKGIQILSEPDPYSRTPGEDGKRIVLIDDHRPWGWRIVNYLKYRNLKNMAQKREADRLRIAEKRKVPKNKDVAGCRNLSQPVADVAHADADAKKDLSPADAGEVAGEAEPPAIPGRVPAIPDCPHEKIVALYHDVLPQCPRIREWNDTRRGYLRARWRDKAKPNGASQGYSTVEDGLAWWRKFFGWVAESSFLTGMATGRGDKRPFVADLEWLGKPSNFVKVIEGKYHDAGA